MRDCLLQCMSPQVAHLGPNLTKAERLLLESRLVFVTTRDQKARRKIIGPTRACEFEGNEADLMLLNTGERHMPTDRLTPGLKAETVTTVDDRLVVKHMGGDGVLSTPSMIGLMERASIEAVQAYLPEGHTTVGFEVHVKHFGATPKGNKVTVRAELLEVDGRKLRFKVEAHDEDKKVGDGTHRRAIIAIRREG